MFLLSQPTSPLVCGNNIIGHVNSHVYLGIYLDAEVSMNFFATQNGGFLLDNHSCTQKATDDFQNKALRIICGFRFNNSTGIEILHNMSGLLVPHRLVMWI